LHFIEFIKRNNCAIVDFWSPLTEWRSFLPKSKFHQQKAVFYMTTPFKNDTLRISLFVGFVLA